LSEREVSPIMPTFKKLIFDSDEKEEEISLNENSFSKGDD